MNQQPVLEIKDLKTHFFTYAGVVKAVDGINLCLNQDEVLGIVGETGCGKSVTARSILKLVPEPGKIVSGEIKLNGKDVLSMNDKEINELRGGQVAMIFQNPLSSLNPLFTIGEQVSHIIRIHQKVKQVAAKERAVEMFNQVRLPNPNQLLDKYPHELSGGQLQRIMIAMALSCLPQLLIADEPTTALDVTIQAQILTLMLRLKKETKTSIMLITHDLGVVAEVCDRVVIMYAGRIVEDAPVDEIFHEPLHPYTKGLMASIPGRNEEDQELAAIAGSVPNLITPPSGCRFHPRCPNAEEICRLKIPELKLYKNRHNIACHLYHPEN
jgi:peptide/nickel transport system ATP-binding protein